MPDIKGYRQLTEDEIRLVNLLKDWEHQADFLLKTLPSDGPSGRWLALARTHIEMGLMFAVKAVTRPEGGLGSR